MKQPHILILGADGLVGQTLFSYFKDTFPNTVWGTVRKKNQQSSSLLPFSVSYGKRDFAVIYQKVGHIEYVINCIGVLNESEKKSLTIVNGKFPHVLEDLTKKMHAKLLHISTDAVFSSLSGEVTEGDTPIPTTDYGKSKLTGETHAFHAITIRTSFLGFDSTHKKGFLEKVLHTDKINFGYTNQTWTGCTTLQFAQFCAHIIETNTFLSLRALSPVFHFTPLSVASKYRLIQTILKTYNKKQTVKKIKGLLITRSLKTSFFDELQINLYTHQIETALLQMKHNL